MPGHRYRGGAADKCARSICEPAQQLDLRHAAPRPLTSAQNKWSQFGCDLSHFALFLNSHIQAIDSARSIAVGIVAEGRPTSSARSEEHTSELQSLMRISYAVFCLKKKIIQPNYNILNNKTI